MFLHLFSAEHKLINYDNVALVNQRGWMSAQASQYQLIVNSPNGALIKRNCAKHELLLIFGTYDEACVSKLQKA
jgi:hypothetical protein